MTRTQNNGDGKIPVWMIVVGFCFSFWPGAILLGIRLWQDYSQRTNGKTRRTDSEWAQNAQDVTWRDVDGKRTYQAPQQSASTQTSNGRYGGWNADGTYHYNYRAGQRTETAQTQAPSAQSQSSQPRQQSASQSSYRQQSRQTQYTQPPKQQPKRSLLDHSRLNPRSGKALRLMGNILVGIGALLAALVFLLLGVFRWDAIQASTLTAMCICIPGAAFSIIGSRKHDKVMRCRTYAAMLGERRYVSIDDLAAAIPTSYKRCCKDLNWMLSEGLLKGMYIDGARRILTYPGASPVQEKPAQPEPVPASEPVSTTPDGQKIYPEEARIRQLNDEIQDEYVSQRMDRLESLTHQIFAYAEEHPDKEAQLRQFRNHYLPKTFSILESYARMERSGVEGGNIAAAMKDVEEIMDKLVLGFEKQLDALFDSEAMDVTTDVTVLENMLGMEGLSDLDPFGSLRKDDDLLRR